MEQTPPTKMYTAIDAIFLSELQLIKLRNFQNIYFKNYIYMLKWFIAAIIAIASCYFILQSSIKNNQSNAVTSSDNQNILATKDNSPNRLDKISEFTWGMPTKGPSRFSGARHGMLPIEATELDREELLKRSRDDGIYAYRAWSLYKNCEDLLHLKSQSNTILENDVNEQCRKFSAKIASHSNELLQIAARSGLSEARIDYINHAFEYFSIETASPDDLKAANEALSMVQEEANRGNADAMLLVAGAYETGFLLAKNPVASYAYEYAAMKTGLLKNRGAVLDILKKRMTESQIQDAINNGDIIFTRCCQ